VEPTHALEYNCVSEKVSADMALNVCRLFSSNYGIGITGYASTQPEIGINDLYAYICIVSEGKVVLAQRTTSPVLDSFAVQIGYTNTVLQKFFELVRS
jgi:nicotinamide mononucleotide (NMN) deamidase PncC